MSGENNRLKLKRLNFLDCATIPTRLLDSEIFPKVAEVLKKGASANPDDKDAAKKEFEKICANAGVPEGPFTDYLWKTMLEVDSKIALTPGWIPGTG